MSDGEPSSIKRLTRCAARAPALSKRYEDRVEARFDFAVYGTRFAAHHFCYNPLKIPNTALLLESDSTYVSKHSRHSLHGELA